MKNVTKSRWASVYANEEFICVETCSGYRGQSIGDPKGVQLYLESNADHESLGASILDALAESRFVVPAPRTDVWQHPDVTFDLDLYDYQKGAERYQAWVANVMRRFSYKTRRSMFKNMRNCGIVDSKKILTFSPTRHVKLEAWESLSKDGTENVVIPTASSPSDIGAALRLALSRCE